MERNVRTFSKQSDLCSEFNTFSEIYLFLLLGLIADLKLNSVGRYFCLALFIKTVAAYFT